MAPLTIGDMAPDFTLSSDDAGDITLSDLRGRKVVLYFYPKDNTSGCTTQACEFRDLKDDFSAKGAVILGVSRDSLKRHQGFRGKHDLNFSLLTDAEHSVHEQYGAWGDKRMYGKTVQGVLRTTVLIDEQGRITHIAHKVKARGNAARTLELLQG